MESLFSPPPIIATENFILSEDPPNSPAKKNYCVTEAEENWFYRKPLP